MRKYQHSGRVNPLAILYAFVAAIVIVPVAAAVYANAIVYIPFVYINAILAAAFGGGIAFCIAFAMVQGKCRNPKVLTLVTSTAVCFGYVLHWAFWVSALFRRADFDASLWDMILEPTGLLETIELINEDGTWSIGSGDNVSGGFLMVFWLIEAGIVLGAGGLVAIALGRDPFCEECGDWCEKHVGVAHFSDVHLENEIEGELLAQGIQRIDSLAPTAGIPCLRFNVHACACQKTQTLSAEFIRVVEGDKGPEFKEYPVFDGLQVSTDEVEYLSRCTPAAIASGTELKAEVSAFT